MFFEQRRPKSLHLTLTEMLWWDLQRAVLKRMLTKLNELRHCCKEEWTKRPPFL